MEDKFYIRLVVIGEDLKPEEITESTGIIPTTIWHKGDVKNPSSAKRRRDVIHKDNGWEIESQLPKCSLLSEHIEWILNRIIPQIDTLLSLTSMYYLELSCAIYYYGRPPEVHFDKHIIKIASTLNIEIDVDLYDMGS